MIIIYILFIMEIIVLVRQYLYIETASVTEAIIEKLVVITVVDVLSLCVARAPFY